MQGPQHAHSLVTNTSVAQDMIAGPPSRAACEACRRETAFKTCSLLKRGDTFVTQACQVGCAGRACALGLHL